MREQKISIKMRNVAPNKGKTIFFPVWRASSVSTHNFSNGFPPITFTFGISVLLYPNLAGSILANAFFAASAM